MATAMQAVGGGLGWSLLPPLMPLVAADLHIAPTASGLVWGSASLGIALGSPFGGTAVDRFGARRVGALAMLVGGAACALRVLATGTASLAATMLLFGLHVAFVAPALPKALAGHLEVARLARANGIALLGYTLGTALTVVIARAWLAPLLGGWRPCMLLAAGLMVVTGLAFGALVTDRGGISHRASFRDLFAIAKNADLRRVAAMHFLLFGGYLALLGLLPRALLAMGTPLEEVGPAIAGWLVCAAVANFGGPIVAARVGRRPVLLGGSVVAALGLGGLALTGAHPLAWLALAALGGGAVAPLLLTAPLEMPEIGAAKAGAAVGFLTLVGQLGGFLLPIGSGALAETSGGFSAALAGLALVHLALELPALALGGASASSLDPAGPRATVGAAA
jgi:NNP family nitrate/nitrite transporter-like MFS transporter